MSMEMWMMPWRPVLDFTGRSIYRIDPDNGMILQHVDEWDAISNNQFLSLEAVQHVLRQFLDVQVTPSLQGPKFQVCTMGMHNHYHNFSYGDYIIFEKSMSRL